MARRYTALELADWTAAMRAHRLDPKKNPKPGPHPGSATFFQLPTLKSLNRFALKQAGII